MAKKSDIKMVLGVEGERQLNESLKNIKAGLKTLNSEMKAVTSEYIGNEKSAEALSAQNDVLTRTVYSLQERLAEEQRALSASATAFGEADEETQKWQRAVFETTAELNKAKAQIDKNNDSVTDLTKAQGENAEATAAEAKQMDGFGGIVSSVGKALGLSTQQTSAFSSVLYGGDMSLAAAGAAAAAAVALAAKAVSEITKLFAQAAKAGGDYADNINTLSKQSGFSTDFLQGVQYASELIDVSAEDIIGAMRKLKKNLYSDSEDVRNAFETLNIIPAELIQHQDSMEDIFKLVIGGLSRLDNDLEKDNISMTLFGRSYENLAGVIDDGGEKLNDLIKGYEDLGYILSGEDLQKLNEMDDAFAELDNEFKNVKNQIAKELAPELTELAKQLLAVAQTVDWQAFGDAAGKVIKDLTPLIVDLVKGIADTANALANLMQQVSEFKNSDAGKIWSTGAKTALSQAVNSIPGVSTIRSLYNAGSALYEGFTAMRDLNSGYSAASSSQPIVVESSISLDGQTVGRAFTPVIETRQALRGNGF